MRWKSGTIECPLRGRLPGCHPLGDLSANFDFRLSEFPGLLQVQPELRRRPEVTREPERRIGRYALGPAENAGHKINRNVQRPRQHVLGDIGGFDLLAQDLAGGAPVSCRSSSPYFLRPPSGDSPRFRRRKLRPLPTGSRCATAC